MFRSLCSRLSFVAPLALTVSTVGCAVEPEAPDSSELLADTTQALNPADPSDPEDQPTTPSAPPPSITVTLDGLSTETLHDDMHYIWGGETLHQIYGTISVVNLTSGRSTTRNLGRWGNPDGYAAVAWGSTNGSAPKLFETGSAPDVWRFGPYVKFADTKLCTASSYSSCLYAYAYNNNRMTVAAKQGDRIQVSFNFKDYDAGSADDAFCSGWQTFTASNSTLLIDYPFRYIKGNAYTDILSTTLSCALWIH